MSMYLVPGNGEGLAGPLHFEAFTGPGYANSAGAALLHAISVDRHRTVECQLPRQWEGLHGVDRRNSERGTTGQGGPIAILDILDRGGCLRLISAVLLAPQAFKARAIRHFDGCKSYWVRSYRTTSRPSAEGSCPSQESCGIKGASAPLRVRARLAQGSARRSRVEWQGEGEPDLPFLSFSRAWRRWPGWG